MQSGGCRQNRHGLGCEVRSMRVRAAKMAWSLFRRVLRLVGGVLGAVLWGPMVSPSGVA